MVQVTELVSQMHETLSDIRSTISSLTSLEHESLLDNAEKHRDTAVASLQSEFAVETTSLAQKRAAEIAAIEEQRRREDEEREARRRHEDEARKANAEAEDKARQRALAEKTSELEEQTEAEMTRIEAEADRKLDEGQARLATLEQRRRKLNRQIDEQMSLPLPIVPLRRKTREQTHKSTPVAISAKEVLGEKHTGDDREDHAVLSASATETTAPAKEPAPPETHQEENAAAETVLEEEPAQVHSPEPVVSVEAAGETTVTDELSEDDQTLTKELDMLETKAAVDEKEHEEEREAVILSVSSVVGADEEAAHERLEEAPVPRILAEASDITPGHIPSIEFIPPTPAPEKSSHELPEARPTKDKAMETSAVADPVESALVATDASHQPEGEATRDTQVIDVAPVDAALPAVEMVPRQTTEETHAAEDLVAVSETMPTQIETPVEILSIPAVPSPEPKMEADVKSTISTKEDEEPVLMYLPSTCYCPEPPVFVFPAPPPALAPVSNEMSDVPLEHGVQVQEEIHNGEEAHEPRHMRQFFDQQTVQDSSSAWHYQAPYVAPDVYAYAAPPPVDERSYSASPQSLEPSPFLHRASTYQEPEENGVTVHGQDDLFEGNNDNESDGSVSSEPVDSPREDQFEYDNIAIDASGTVIVQHRSPAIAEADVPETPATVVGDAQSHEARAAAQAIHVARPDTPEASSYHAPTDGQPAPVTPPQLYDGNDDDARFDDDFMPRDVTHISWSAHNVYTTPGSVRSEATVSEASFSATPGNSGLDLHHSEPVIRSSWADTPPDIVMNGRSKALGQLDYALSLDTTTPANTSPTTAILQQQQQQQQQKLPKSRPSSIAAVSPSILFQRMRNIFEPASGASAVSDGQSSRNLDSVMGSAGNRLAESGFVKGIADASATVDDPERRHNDYHHYYQDADEEDRFSEQTSLLQAAAPISPSY